MLIFCVLDVHDVSTLWQSMSTNLHREVALSEKVGQNFVYKINENSSFKKKYMLISAMCMYFTESQPERLLQNGNLMSQ